MSAPMQYKVYSKITGVLLAEGTARHCSEVLCAPSDTIRAIARGKHGSYKYLVEEQEQEENNRDSGFVSAAKKWDAFCEPIRKRYGIPVRHLGEEKKKEMKEYHKIETLFNRAVDGSKKLIVNSWRNETVEFLKNNRWHFTEKIDGTNIRVNWDGHKVTFGGRTDRAQIPAKLVAFLNDTFGSNEAEQIFEQKFGETEVTLYGEGYGAGIQSGGNYRPDVSFILFDVLIGDIWLTRESVEDIAEAFGIDVVPFLGVGTLDDAIRIVMNKPTSKIGAAPMEGIVARPDVEVRDRLGRRVIVKIKIKDFDGLCGGW